jgi:hypothetical protein
MDSERYQIQFKNIYTELYDASLNEFGKILGDSLIEMNELRGSKLVAPKIKFELSDTDLKELQRDT